MRDEREITPHYLDDPSEGGNWGVLFAHLVLVVIAALGWHYRPLATSLLGPKPQAISLCDGTQWLVEAGIVIDPNTHQIRRK